MAHTFVIFTVGLIGPNYPSDRCLGTKSLFRPFLFRELREYVFVFDFGLLGKYRDSPVFQEANDTKMSVMDELVPLLILFSSQVTDN